jgi:transposase
LARRRQLLEMLQAERNRLGQVFGRGKTPVRKSLTAHIAYLERDLRITDSDLGDVVRRSPAWRERDARLQSVPGESASSCRSRSLPMSPSLGANRVARS